MVTVLKGKTKGSGKTELLNDTGGMRKMYYIISNPLAVSLTVTVFIAGIQVGPKDMVIAVGESLRDDGLYVGDGERVEIKSNNALHYYVVFE